VEHPLESRRAHQSPAAGIQTCMKRAEIEAHRALVRVIALVAGCFAVGSGCAAPADPGESALGAAQQADENWRCTQACYDDTQCTDEAGFAVTDCLTPCPNDACVASCEDNYHAAVAQCGAATDACVASCEGGPFGPGGPGGPFGPGGPIGGPIGPVGGPIGPLGALGGPPVGHPGDGHSGDLGGAPPPDVKGDGEPPKGDDGHAPDGAGDGPAPVHGAGDTGTGVGAEPPVPATGKGGHGGLTK
jgi:hypothetical protein